MSVRGDCGGERDEVTVRGDCGRDRVRDEGECEGRLWSRESEG